MCSILGVVDVFSLPTTKISLLKEAQLLLGSRFSAQLVIDQDEEEEEAAASMLEEKRGPAYNTYYNLAWPGICYSIYRCRIIG